MKYDLLIEILKYIISKSSIIYLFKLSENFIFKFFYVHLKIFGVKIINNITIKNFIFIFFLISINLIMILSKLFLILYQKILNL